MLPVFPHACKVEERDHVVYSQGMLDALSAVGWTMSTCTRWSQLTRKHRRMLHMRLAGYACVEAPLARPHLERWCGADEWCSRRERARAERAHTLDDLLVPRISGAAPPVVRAQPHTHACSRRMQHCW